MPPENTPQSQQTPAFDDYTWIKGANDKWDSACLRVQAKRVDLGLKGFDKKHGKPGYIAIAMTRDGLLELAALAKDAAKRLAEAA